MQIKHKSIKRLRAAEQRRAYLELLARSGLLTRSQSVELAKLRGTSR